MSKNCKCRGKSNEPVKLVCPEDKLKKCILKKTQRVIDETVSLFYNSITFNLNLQTSQESYNIAIDDTVNDTDMNSIVHVLGINNLENLNETGNVTTPFSLENNHLGIKVNSLDGSGTMAVEGLRLNEQTGIITMFTENITIDEATTYQTYAKFYVIESITLTGVTSIDYNYGQLGYFDDNNFDFRLDSLRMEVDNTDESRFRLRFFNIKNLGNNKYTRIILEDIDFYAGFNNANPGHIIDYVRTGTLARNLSAPVLTTQFWQKKLIFKQSDYNEVFSTDAEILGSQNGGLIVEILGQDLDNVGATEFWLRLKTVPI